MSTMGQVETHESVMRLHDSLVDLEVGRATTEGLHVHTPLRRVEVECLESASLAGQLNGIDVLVSTVVSRTGVPLGVLVGHGRSESVEHGAGGNILRCNQENRLALSLNLQLHDRRNLGIRLEEGLLEHLESIESVSGATCPDQRDLTVLCCSERA